MTIQEYNPRQFTVKGSGSLRSAFFMIGVILFLPLLAVLSTGNGFRLTCQRTNSSEGTCEITYLSLLSKREKISFALSELSEAKTEKSIIDSESGESECYTPTILVNQGDLLRVFKIQPSTCDELETNEIVSQINSFIATPTEDKLHIHQGWQYVLFTRFDGLWLWSMICLFGFILVGNDSFSNCVFNLDQNRFKMTHKFWFYTTSIDEYSLDEIESITFEIRGEKGISSEYRVIVKPKSGKEVMLPHGSCSAEKIFADLRQFLESQRGITFTKY